MKAITQNCSTSKTSLSSTERDYWIRHSDLAHKAMGKHIKMVKRALLTHHQNLNWDVFETNAKRKFEPLLPLLPLHPATPRHLFNQLMPTLAAMGATFRVLRELGYTANQIGRIYYEGYLDDFNRIRARIGEPPPKGAFKSSAPSSTAATKEEFA